jgi:SPOR domain
MSGRASVRTLVCTAILLCAPISTKGAALAKFTTVSHPTEVGVRYGLLPEMLTAQIDQRPRSSSLEGRAPSKYYIQVLAVMDKSGADQMMERLRRLGYLSRRVSTEIDGRRWYRVEVGPYTTQEAATEARVGLQEKYQAAFGRDNHSSSVRTDKNDHR